MKIEKFNDFITEKVSDDIKDELEAKNPDHPYLKAFKNDDEFNEIKDLWQTDRKEAARAFRAKLVKIANSKLGIALLLMVSGVAITATGYNALAAKTPVVTPPPHPKPPSADYYTIKKGDSIWKIAKHILPKGTSNADIMEYVKQIATQNGMEKNLIDGVLTKVPGDPDLIFPGGKLIINKFIG